jgi:phosphatidylserine synthase
VIQKDFAKEVDFNMYCNVQSASWYVGLARAAAALLTVVIYVMMYRRKQSKRRVQRLSTIGVAR